MLSVLFPRSITPPTSKTTIRGPSASRASRSEPGPGGMQVRHPQDLTASAAGCCRCPAPGPGKGKSEGCAADAVVTAIASQPRHPKGRIAFMPCVPFLSCLHNRELVVWQVPCRGVTASVPRWISRRCQGETSCWKNAGPSHRRRHGRHTRTAATRHSPARQRQAGRGRCRRPGFPGR